MKNAMKQNQLVARIAVVLAVGFSSSVALADEGVVLVKLSYGTASYSSPSVYGDIGSTYTTMALGMTYIGPSNIFLDFTTKSSTPGATYNSSDLSFSRMDNTLTIGMPLEQFSGVQVNAGVFTADTAVKLPQSGQVVQKLNGVSAGAGKVFPIREGKAGVFSLSGGFALLNGSRIDQLGGGTATSLAYGLSVGGAYNYAINKTFTVAVDTKLQSYFISYATISGDERIRSAALSLLGKF